MKKFSIVIGATLKGKNLLPLEGREQILSFKSSPFERRVLLNRETDIFILKLYLFIQKAIYIYHKQVYIYRLVLLHLVFIPSKRRSF